jgi:twitching motility protein PilI
MAKRIDLRAYQESIASRLAAAQAGAAVPALLGFAAAGQRWLVDLTTAGEVIPLPPLASVPLTQPWFAGLASVHGELQAVVDFAVFCGAAPTPRAASARLLRIGLRQAASGAQSALLVERVYGLKRSDTLFAADVAEGLPVAGPPAAWRGAFFTDTQGVRWQQLDMTALQRDPVFLDAALPSSDAVGQ